MNLSEQASVSSVYCLNQRSCLFGIVEIFFIPVASFCSPTDGFLSLSFSVYRQQFNIEIETLAAESRMLFPLVRDFKMLRKNTVSLLFSGQQGHHREIFPSSGSL